MKVTDIFFSRGELFISFEDGERDGQILWNGEVMTTSFGLFQFQAQQIKPVTWGQVRWHFRDFEVIRKLDKSEYPALEQAIQDYCEKNRESGGRLVVEFMPF